VHLTVVLAESDPSALLPARWQMAVTLGSHIVLACFGVAFPAMIFVVHRRGLRDDDTVALGLAQRWSKVAAVLLAVGAVSGTILSFEMGLLWPELMRTYGDVIGLPFALEGIAFFVEAIFIGIYLYGWHRLPGRVHLLMLVPIMVAGVVGTFCILSVNAWMNAPTGFRLEGGAVVDVDPWSAMFNDAVWLMALHMWVATLMVVGICVAAVYTTGLLRGRNDRHHHLGFAVAFAFAAVAAIAQPFIGHQAGTRLSVDQPTKLAAVELADRTEGPAPLAIGGVLIDGERRYSLDIPRLGSVFGRSSLDAPITGLDEFPADARSRDGLATMVHWSFQGMVAGGTALMALGIVYWISRRRGRDLLERRSFLRLAVLAGPVAVACLEFGWITTEVGRQHRAVGAGSTGSLLAR
jgi:cytochrome d ubiquinol oxidase subunit I